MDDDDTQDDPLHPRHPDPVEMLHQALFDAQLGRERLQSAVGKVDAEDAVTAATIALASILSAKAALRRRFVRELAALEQTQHAAHAVHVSCVALIDQLDGALARIAEPAARAELEQLRLGVTLVNDDGPPAMDAQPAERPRPRQPGGAFVIMRHEIQRPSAIPSDAVVVSRTVTAGRDREVLTDATRARPTSGGPNGTGNRGGAMVTDNDSTQEGPALHAASVPVDLYRALIDALNEVQQASTFLLTAVRGDLFDDAMIAAHDAHAWWRIAEATFQRTAIRTRLALTKEAADQLQQAELALDVTLHTLDERLVFALLTSHEPSVRRELQQLQHDLAIARANASRRAKARI